MSRRSEVSETREEAICAICEDPRPHYRWTDTHGIAACGTCGAPYRIYHYEDNRRVDRPPLLMLREEWVPLTRRYWQETQRNCDPGAFNFPGSSYEVATDADCRVYSEWMEAHRSEHPQQEEPTR